MLAKEAKKRNTSKFRLSCRRSDEGIHPLRYNVIKELDMPKLKTSRSAAKRFSTTGSGKFRRRRQALRHILTKKDAKRRMRLGQSALVDSTNLKAVKRLLPYA